MPTAAAASINLAQTVVVLGYAWHRLATSGAAAPAASLAPVVAAPEDAPERAQVEAMYEQLRVLLRRVGYTDAARETAVMRKYRTLLGRAAPTTDEVTLLRGLWYQLAWAVEQVPGRLPGPAPAERRADGAGTEAVDRALD